MNKQSGNQPTAGISETQLAGILDIAEDAVICVDSAQCIILFNKGAEKIFGYEAREVIGHPIEMLIPSPFRQSHRAHLSGFGVSGVAARTMGERGGIYGLRKDGTEFPAEASISRLMSDGQTVFTAILRDVTERKKQAEALHKAKETAEAATQAKSMFLANMSHEIRTPLNAIIGMTSLLLDTAMTDEQKDFAQTIRASGEALLTIINDILDFSKIELGKLELERQPFDLRRCIEDSLDLLAPKAAEKNLNLAYMIDDSVPAVLVSDASRLRQILVNLLSNATKFTQQGEVFVSVEARPATEGRVEVHFSVKDTGIGIPADRIGQLFQSFSQVDTSTTRKYGGTGLGLAISRRLAELMGGTMWVESQLSKGSTFHFTVQAEPGEPGLARSYLREGSPALTGKRILLVDDNTTNRRILVKQALQWGMLPSAAASAIEALDLIRHGHAFEVAILDMAMPEMDGLGLAREIRKYRDAKALPLIMLTSMGQRQKGTRTDQVEFAAYLNKPIKPSQLFDVLMEVLRVEPAQGSVAEPRSAVDSRLAEKLPLSILVAEDNAVNQKVALRLLARVGYRADVVANGVEVLDALERQNYDVILMDVQMPEMDGLEATRRILQRLAAGSRPYIIAMTANAMPGDREQCLAAGMDGYISKPIALEELQGVLKVAGKRVRRPAESGADRGGPLDRSRFSYLRDLEDEANPHMVRELIDLFFADSPKHLANLYRAINDRNSQALKEVAHRFKSGVDNLGAVNMSALCVKLEEIGRGGTVEGAEMILADLNDEYQRVYQALLAEREK